MFVLLLIFLVIGFALYVTSGGNSPKYPDMHQSTYDKNREATLSEEHQWMDEPELRKSIAMRDWLLKHPKKDD